MSFTWAKLVHDMQLTGLAKMVACFTEVKRYDSVALELDVEISSNFKAIEQHPAFSVLERQLRDYFGEDLALTVSFGPAKGSPANIAYVERIQQYSTAYTQLAQDDVVGRLIAEFGGKVIVESVRPAGASR